MTAAIYGGVKIAFAGAFVFSVLSGVAALLLWRTTRQETAGDQRRRDVSGREDRAITDYRARRTDKALETVR